MHIRLIACGAFVGAVAVAVALAAPTQAARGLVTIHQTGSNWSVTLTWTGGSECKGITLPQPIGTVVKGTELQVRNAFALDGFNSRNCTRTSTGGMVNGGDFRVVGPYSEDDYQLIYPDVSQRYMSFRPAATG
ncbi:hypothetical protein [Nocardia sp. NPDC051463]|uniref:hypothetical protein n=1 Tax=Nocardia sp. NPDC051463 TaxID=3154845 RepID=UPI00344B79BF